MASETQAEFTQSGVTVAPSSFRVRSPAVWAGCPIEQINSGKVDGTFCRDDFKKIGGVSAMLTTAGTLFPSDMNWAAFGSTGATHLVASAVQDGTVALGSDAANEAACLYQLSKPFKIALGQGSFWFEACWKVTTLTVSVLDIFCGLTETITPTTSTPITNTDGTMADINFVGFHRAATGSAATGDAGSLRIGAYKADGQTVAAVETATSILTADTFIKTAFTFNERDGKLRFFINNVLRSTTYTLTSTAGNPFPNDVALGLMLACEVATSGAATDLFTVDWIQAAQVGAGQGYFPAV